MYLTLLAGLRSYHAQADLESRFRMLQGEYLKKFHNIKQCFRFRFKVPHAFQSVSTRPS